MTENDYSKDIYLKKVTCPVCNSTFEEPVVKVNSPRILSKDTDFFIRYKGINPYFYDVWVCNTCGYAAMKSEFDKLKSYNHEKILTNITKKWQPKTYLNIYDPLHAIEKYKLALITALSVKSKISVPSMISLKLAWMYRLINDNKNEQIFLKKALSGFLTAYSEEDFPIFGMQRDSISYLLGELNRRTGNKDQALQWYSKVITTVGASPRIKELARDGKDMLSEN